MSYWSAHLRSSWRGDFALYSMIFPAFVSTLSLVHVERHVKSGARPTLRFVWAIRRNCWRSSTLSCLDSLLDKVRPPSLMPGTMRVSHLDQALVRQGGLRATDRGEWVTFLACGPKHLSLAPYST